MQEQITKAVKDAIENSKTRNFKESVELAFNLKDVDLSIAKNRVDEEIPLPKGRGKAVKIAIFASGELALKSKNSADKVISPEEIEELAGEKKKARKLANSYDYFLAETGLMTTIGKRLGAIFAPRGKMPKPIPATIDPSAIISAMRNTVRVRSKERRTFHVLVGVKDMSIEDLSTNIEAVLKRVEAKLERGRDNIESVYVKTTMGKAVRVI